MHTLHIWQFRQTWNIVKPETEWKYKISTVDSPELDSIRMFSNCNLRIDNNQESWGLVCGCTMNKPGGFIAQ